jgi:hypothetical protein
MDYKIKFEYKDAGRGIDRQRKQLESLVKKQSGSGAAAQAGGAKDAGVQQTGKLNDSIKKLIDSNKSLERAVSRSGRGAAAGGGATGGGRFGDTGIGNVGSSLPYIGAVVAIVGFALNKINQVADAYLSLGMQQKGNAGITGTNNVSSALFSAAEIGGGRKAYAMQTGRFASGRGAINQNSLRMANIFGLSPEEVLGQAGTFARVGKEAAYGSAMYGAAGAGIETELPILMSALSSELEEAVKNGVDASSMAESIGGELTALTMRTQTKSVDAAMKIIQSFSSTKEAVSRGQVGGYQNVMAWKAGRDMLVETMSDPTKRASYLEQMQKAGVISAEESGRLGSMQDVSLKSIQDIVGVGGVKVLTERMISQTGEGEMLRRSILQQQKYFGTDAKGARAAWNVYANQGGSATQEQFFAAYQNAAAGVPAASIQAGQGVLGAQENVALTSISATAMGRQNEREAMTFRYGERFTREALKFEKAMMNLTSKSMPAIGLGLDFMSSGIENATAAFEVLCDVLGKITEKLGNLFDLSSMMPDGLRGASEDLINPGEALHNWYFGEY